MLDLQSYLRGKGRNVPLKKGRLDLTSYMLGKAAGGGIQEISGTLPLYVRSRASQILQNYIIYGTASGAGVETENLFSGKGETRNIGAASVKQFIESNTQISPGETYHINGSSGLYSRLGFYMNGTRVTNSNWVSTQSSITTPDDCNNMYVEVRNYSYDVVTDEQLATATEIMLTSEEPPSYIPHGYKLPMTVTSNGTTTDYPIYIGDSKLMEGEYVDYETRKVYKRGENEFPFAEKGTFAFGNGSVISDGAGTFIINTENNDTNVPSNLIPLTTPYTVPQTNGEYTFYLGNTSTNSGLLIVFYDSERNLVDDWMYNYTWRKESSIPLMVGKTIAYVGFRINTNYSGSANMSVTPMISKNNNLTDYVPYIQPTNPPVPLPDITLPQGTVTIDIEGDLKPQATVNGRIEQIT